MWTQLQNELLKCREQGTETVQTHLFAVLTLLSKLRTVPEALSATAKQQLRVMTDSLHQLARGSSLHNGKGALLNKVGGGHRVGARLASLVRVRVAVARAHGHVRTKTGKVKRDLGKAVDDIALGRSLQTLGLPPEAKPAPTPGTKAAAR